MLKILRKTLRKRFQKRYYLSNPYRLIKKKDAGYFSCIFLFLCYSLLRVRADPQQIFYSPPSAGAAAALGSTPPAAAAAAAAASISALC